MNYNPFQSNPFQLSIKQDLSYQLITNHSRLKNLDNILYFIEEETTSFSKFEKKVLLEIFELLNNHIITVKKPDLFVWDILLKFISVVQEPHEILDESFLEDFGETNEKISLFIHHLFSKFINAELIFDRVFPRLPDKLKKYVFSSKQELNRYFSCLPVNEETFAFFKLYWSNLNVKDDKFSEFMFYRPADLPLEFYIYTFMKSTETSFKLNLTNKEKDLFVRIDGLLEELTKRFMHITIFLFDLFDYLIREIGLSTHDSEFRLLEKFTETGNPNKLIPKYAYLKAQVILGESLEDSIYQTKEERSIVLYNTLLMTEGYQDSLRILASLILGPGKQVDSVGELLYLLSRKT